MSGAEPFTFLSLRFFIAGVLIACIGFFLSTRWPRSPLAYAHLAVSGALIHGVYLGAVFAAIYHGLPAGISAVIVSLHPLLTAAIATRWLGERLTLWNVAGLFIALFGLVLVLGGEKLLEMPATTSGIILSVAGLFGISLGTLYQKRFCTDFDLLSGTSIQYASATLLLLIPALLIETREISWTPAVFGAMLWLVVALSLIAVILLMFLIRHGEANRVATLFYLVPALTTLETWLLFDEQLSVQAICGIILCMGGVYLARSSAERSTQSESS